MTLVNSTLIPFSSGSMGIDIDYVGDTERKLKCWIGSKFWAFSFYSIITLAVLSALAMLIYISWKIVKWKHKMWRKQRVLKDMLSEDRRSTVSMYGQRERDSSMGNNLLSTCTSTRDQYRGKEIVVLQRFGMFVGCYLFCWYGITAFVHLLSVTRCVVAVVC